MTYSYSPLPAWHSPSKTNPSLTFVGETSTEPIHQAVGRALSSWEQAESGFVKLFQLLCETKSFAACRAYGTIENQFGRYLALKYAAEEFFASREQSDLKITETLLKTYSNSGKYRNELAHGMAAQPHAFGYFLCPPSYAARRRNSPNPYGLWGLDADYFYRVVEINCFTERFTQILNSTMSLVLYLNEKYEILHLSDFHP